MADERPFRVVEPVGAWPNEPAVSCSEINWQKCVLRQDDKSNEKLQCPSSNSNKHAVETGYVNFATKLQGFYEIGYVGFGPVWTFFGRQDVPAAVVLEQNSAKWHRSCYLKYNQNELSRAQKRKTETDSSSASKCAKTNTRRRYAFDAKLYACYFCEEPSSPGTLCNVATFELDSKIRTCAADLQDDHLLAKLAGCDLIAQEAKYHRKCLVALYNRWRSKTNSRDGQNKQTVCEGLALAHVVRFMEETLALTTDCHPVFRMSDLRQMYRTRLHELVCNGDADSSDSDSCKCMHVHNTRLKERILCHFPQMEAQKVGKSYLLLYSENVGDAVHAACETDYDDDALCLSKAAKIVRNEM